MFKKLMKYSLRNNLLEDKRTLFFSHNDLDGAASAYLAAKLFGKGVFKRHVRGLEKDDAESIARIHCTSYLGDEFYKVMHEMVKYHTYMFRDNADPAKPLNVFITDIGNMNIPQLHAFADAYNLRFVVIDHHPTRITSTKNCPVTKIELEGFAHTLYMTPDLRVIYYYEETVVSAAKLVVDFYNDICDDVLPEVMPYEFYSVLAEVVSKYDTGNFGNWNKSKGKISPQYYLNTLYFLLDDRKAMEDLFGEDYYVSAMPMIFPLFQTMRLCYDDKPTTDQDVLEKRLIDIIPEALEIALRDGEDYAKQILLMLDNQLDGLVVQNEAWIKELKPIKVTGDHVIIGGHSVKIPEDHVPDTIWVKPQKSSNYSVFAKDFLADKPNDVFIGVDENVYKNLIIYQLRSSEYDCHALATLNGGGGHKRASGFTRPMSKQSV